MNNSFPYTYVCEKCGKEFYSKADPSNWAHTICNACSGKPYKDFPVEQQSKVVQFTPKSVPVSKLTKTYAPQPKAEFDYEKYIEEMLIVYGMLKHKADLAQYTIPEESLCAWTTSIMIQRNK